MQKEPPQTISLPDGLLLRGATQEDIEPLAEFEAKNMHFPMGFHIREWMRGDHPTNGLEHFTVVEDTATKQIVSAACLIPQTFLYEHVPFAAGRVEAVATDPAYRRRGLVRRQLEALHARAEEQLVQVVEGATWLYRRFGYVHALENTGGMNSGGRVCYPQQVPPLPEGQPEPYRVRPATTTDLSFVASVYDNSRQRYLLTSREPLHHWEYVLRGGSDGYNQWFALRIVETRQGEPVGFVLHDPWGAGYVLLFEVAPGTSWLAVTPSVLRYLFQEGRRVAALNGGDCSMLRFCFASQHPIYDVSPHWLTPSGHPYAGWYLRVPRLDRFLNHIAPALNQRLASSLLAGHTGELKLNFYDTGATLRINQGQIESVASWMPKHEREGDAVFTQETFLPILFGQRSLVQVREADPDCWVASNEALVLLQVLFPQKHSHLGPLA